jgi:hypothetical protein
LSESRRPRAFDGASNFAFFRFLRLLILAGRDAERRNMLACRTPPDRGRMPMATAAQSPNDLTRQQLDELDALLQRMLSLPLNPPESFPSNGTASVQNFAPPMPMPAPVQSPPPVAREVPMPVIAPRVFTPPAPEPAEMPALWKSAPAPVVTPAPRLTPAPAPIHAPAPMPAPAFEWPDSASAGTLPVAPPAAREEPAPFLYAPFVGCNAVLNWTLGLFGFPGRVLRSGFVKSLFGLAGLGLLVYTGLKVAQIHGLVTLPQQLPWPR